MAEKQESLSPYLCPLTVLLLLSAAFGSGGCATSRQQSDTHDYLDQSTGTTVTALTSPVIFFHEQPGLAANSRDYLYVGPVEMNRMGKRSYYLWFGEWSSIDRTLAGDQDNISLSEIVLVLDGTPMELNDALSPYDKSSIITPPYSMPVASPRSIYVRVSRDQLNIIGTADNVAVRITQGDSVNTYHLWSGSLSALGAITNNNNPARAGTRLVDVSD